MSRFNEKITYRQWSLLQPALHVYVFWLKPTPHTLRACTGFIFTLLKVLWFQDSKISSASERFFGLGATTAILGTQQLGLAPSFWH